MINQQILLRSLAKRQSSQELFPLPHGRRQHKMDPDARGLGRLRHLRLHDEHMSTRRGLYMSRAESPMDGENLSARYGRLVLNEIDVAELVSRPDLLFPQR